MGVNNAGLSVNGAIGSAGQLRGTITNDNALPGNVGEIIESTVLVGAAVGLTSGVSANVTSVSLTPGDWDVWGSIDTNPNAATTMTVLSGGISTVSATIPTYPNGGANISSTITFTTGAAQALSVGKTRISIAVTTTVYLVANSTFAVNTNAVYGYLGARRRR